MKWTNIYKEMSDVYVKEFKIRETEGIETARGIHEYVKSKFKGIKRILDIPCGTGRISIPLAKLGYEVMGIDFSEHFVEEARKSVRELQIDNANFLVGDMLETNKVISDFNPQLILNWWTSIDYHGKMNDIRFLKHLRNISDSGSILMLETWNRENIITAPIPRFWNDLGNILVLVKQNIDPFSKFVIAQHIYYERKGKGLEFIGEFRSKIMLYDVSELKQILTQSGWIVDETFNQIVNREKFNPNLDRVVFVCHSD